jgi:predicted NAD/FAD-binding protein
VAAAYLLSHRHRMHLFEREHCLGGPTNTLTGSVSATLEQQSPVAFSWIRDRKV